MFNLYATDTFPSLKDYARYDGADLARVASTTACTKYMFYYRARGKPWKPSCHACGICVAIPLVKAASWRGTGSRAA